MDILYEFQLHIENDLTLEFCISNDIYRNKFKSKYFGIETEGRKYYLHNNIIYNFNTYNIDSYRYADDFKYLLKNNNLLIKEIDFANDSYKYYYKNYNKKKIYKFSKYSKSYCNMNFYYDKYFYYDKSFNIIDIKLLRDLNIDGKYKCNNINIILKYNNNKIYYKIKIEYDMDRMYINFENYKLIF